MFPPWFFNIMNNLWKERGPKKSLIKNVGLNAMTLYSTSKKGGIYLSLWNLDRLVSPQRHKGRAASWDFPRALPSWNPSEQPCQPSDDPFHPSSFTWINLICYQLMVNTSGYKRGGGVTNCKLHNFESKYQSNSESYDWHGFFGIKFRGGQNFYLRLAVFLTKESTLGLTGWNLFYPLGLKLNR